MILKDELRKLVELQKIDGEIYKIRKDRDDTKPQLLAKYNAELAEKKQLLKNSEDKLKQALLKKKEKELELAAKEDGVQKAQGALYQLKSNKEYQAKLNEISSLKADISIYDEEVLKAIDAIEKAEAELKAAKESFVSDEKRINADIAVVTGEVAEIDSKLKELDSKRSMIKSGVDPDILAKYDKLLEKRSGLAITPIVNNICSYCHMSVNHQKINEIKMYKDLALCDSCNRIVYIPEDFERD